MRVLVLACAVAAAAVGLSASAVADPSRAVSKPGERSNPAVRALVRGVNDQSQVRDLDVRKLDVRVQLRGALAETSIDMRVFATTSEPVEGRVHIDLPAGSVVTGYAVDVGGTMVEGALVDAPKAKAAYERNVRTDIDPGLAEIDAAGGFNTRVSPIDDKTGRTIRLKFVSPVGSNWELPLKADARGGWSVTVRPTGGDRYAVRLGDSAARPELHERGSGRLDGNLRIEALRGEDAIASRHPNGELFWQASGPLPATSAAQGGTVRILWDRSRSRRDQDHAAELRRVEEALRTLAPQSIEWVAFSSGKPQRGMLSSAADVAREAGTVRYAGATSFQTIAGDAPTDVCLLVSDGRATLDQSPVQALPCRVFAIASDRGADWARLGALASASGGQLVETGERKIDWAAPAVEAVLDSAGNRLDFVALPAARGEWRLATRAPAGGTIRVRVGGTTVERQPRGPAEPFGGEGAMIAAVRLASLEGSGARKDFLELSRRYSVASPSLSFAVLETPDDYVRNDITPPTTYVRLAEWRALRADADEDEAAAKAERFDTLLAAWKQQVEWWERTFDLTARPPRQQSPKAGAVPRTMPAAPPPPPPPPPPGMQNCPDGSVVPAGASCPVPPPPPPPPAAERDDPADGAVDSGALVVTGSRRREANSTSPSAVTVLSSQDLRLRGTTRTQDLINSLPQSLAPSDVRISASALHTSRAYIAAYDANPSAFDRIYAEWERKAGDVPAFYLDTADWLARHNRKELAVETLLSALDLPTADIVTIGMVAARLERYAMLDQAVALRERQAQLDPDRPQARRLLALALARRAALGGHNAKADYQRAVRLLADIALSPVDGEWEGVDLIALVEANAFLARLRRLGGDVELDPRLVRNLDSDVRVVLDWSNDDADIDLWVDEPNGQRAIYNYPRTLIGGHMSNDMTDGYGPEEYFLRRAAPGRYIVRANVYSPDQLDPNGPSRVTAHLYRDWGRPTERRESIDLDLVKSMNGEVRIGTLTVDGRPADASGTLAPPTQRR